MNVPHIQYLQQLQQLPQGSPQVSQIQLQQQQQLQQRQQILNQHLQQQSQNPQQSQSQANSSSINPLLAIINGNSNNNQNLQQVQMQQLQQQQQQQQQQPQVPQYQQFQNVHPIQQLQQLQHPAPQPTHQVPVIREVWAHNLEHEFHALRTFANDKVNSVYISIHQEIPGIVSRPVGSFKSQPDYHFQTLRSNADLLNLIQLSLCVVKVNKNNEFSNLIIWQFNFLYDISKEMFNEEHLSMLAQNSQINFQMAVTDGIPHFNFAELILESGLLLDNTINWISFHAGYDLGYFVSLLKNDVLPINEEDFHWYVNKYFPNFMDLKLIGSQLLNKGSDSKASKPSIEYLAEELHLLPISPVIRQFFTSNSNNLNNQHLTSTLHTYLIMECFKELLRQSGFDYTLFKKFSGMIWGLNINETPGSGPSTPGTTVKSGVVHFGRPF